MKIIVIGDILISVKTDPADIKVGDNVTYSQSGKLLVP
jgi:hypothetical protein